MPGRPEPGGRMRRVSRWILVALLLIAALTLLWWAVGRVTAEDHRLAVRRTAHVAAHEADSVREVRIVAWNIAHGRGDVGPGWLQSWRGGSADHRMTRLDRIAEVLRSTDADVVVLNEVDFDAGWSGGVNQAEILARRAGYPTWVEQRNYDLQFPFVRYAFGNAVLTRLPVREVRWIGLPPHSRIEAMMLGSKTASVVRLETSQGPLSVVPVHLEPRSEETRRAAASILDALRDETTAPLVLAGDFNTAPPGWPGVEEPTAVGALLRRGWTSARAEGSSTGELTYPTRDLTRALDWILVEPPLRVVEARVLPGVGHLSDHAPVLAVIRVPSRPRGADPEGHEGR